MRGRCEASLYLSLNKLTNPSSVSSADSFPPRGSRFSSVPFISYGCVCHICFSPVCVTNKKDRNELQSSKYEVFLQLNFHKNPRHARGFLYLGCSQPWTSRRRAQGWRERTNITKPIEILAISMERVALKPRRAGMGSPKTLAVFGESEATMNNLCLYG